MGTTWLTSDLHLGHKKLAEIRGFQSVDIHDFAILNILASTNTPGDTWYLLGDLVMGYQKESLLYDLSSVFDGSQVHVILGNHDRAHPCNRNAHQHVRYFYELFDSVMTSASIRHEGTTYLLSHFPYDGEGEHQSSGDRFPQWRLRDIGLPVIHGHTHSPVKRSTSRKGTSQYHCGIDAWGLKPVRIHDLVAD